MTLAAVLAPLCTAVAVSLVWPQVIRVYKLRSVEGLAPFGTMHGLTGCTLWTLYGVASHLPAVILANAGIGSAMFLIGLAQVRHRVLPAAVLFGGLAGIVAFGLGSVAVSTSLTGVLASVVGVTSIIPQTLYVIRTTDLSAVSRSTYALICTSCSLWAVYGLTLADPIVVLSNLAILPCAAFILVRASRAQALPTTPELASV